MKILNLGILAHVDAGKTSLTERLLYNSGVIDTLGSVDHGDTQTDTLALERQRGITIKTAVTSFDVGDLKVNLIDTPGHPDFIAEVERALSVLDAVVLVLSAVEGIQPQTRILMRALQRMHIPTIMFINKMDRMGARSDELVEEIKTKLFPRVVVMSSVTNKGTSDVKVGDRTLDPQFPAELVSLLADQDDELLNLLTSNQSAATRQKLQSSFTNQIMGMQICPIYFGSAIQGVGVAELTKALETCFQVAEPNTKNLSAVVFKVDRGQRDEKIAYLRLYSGMLHAREQITLSRVKAGGPAFEYSAKITAMQTFCDGKSIDANVVSAGDIVKVWGLSDCQINDYLGIFPSRLKSTTHFDRPSLEIVVSPVTQSDAPKLFTALQRTSEQDPFVEIRRSDRDNALSVRICGEVQKEVIEDTLRQDYGIEVLFSETTVICIERPISIGEAVEIGAKGDPYLGTVGLRVEPGPVGSGICYERASDVLGTMPDAFFVAIEETVKNSLNEGIFGWQVTDCFITLTATGYWPRQSHAHASFDKSMSSTAGDYRNMTPLALMTALKKAGVTVYEPMNRFEFEVPQATLSTVMQGLVAVEARLTMAPNSVGDSVHLRGLIPARRTFEFERSIPDLTNGEGTFVTEPGEYQAVQGIPPIRDRTDNNPLNREEYLKRITARN